MGTWYYYCCLDCKKFADFGKYPYWQSERNWIKMNLDKGKSYTIKENEVGYVAKVDWEWAGSMEKHIDFLIKHKGHNIVIVSEFDEPFCDELPDDPKYGAISKGWTKDD